MLTRMPHYVVVLPVAPLRVGTGFAVEDWPLHVTIVGNFRSRSSEAELAAVLSTTARQWRPIDVIVGGEERFGPMHDIRVSIRADPEPLSSRHDALLSALERECGLALDVPEYSRSGYRPHVTVTRTARAVEGEKLTLGQLVLVDMSPPGNGDLRVVVATSDLPRE